MSRSLPEWIGKTPDTPIPPRVQDRVRERCGNACKGCTRPLRNENGHIDHIIALINDGEHREDNMQLLCEWCHASKTAQDVAMKSRSARVRQRHRGIKGKKRSGFLTNRDGPFRKRMDGSVVRR